MGSTTTNQITDQMNSQMTDHMLMLVYRNLKNEHWNHHELGSVDFHQTEELTSEKLSMLFPKKDVEKFQIVLTNKKGPRAELFYQLFGRSTQLDFKPYKSQKDFMPGEHDCRNDSEDLILINTAFQKGIEYLQSDDYKGGNKLIISQITRMLLTGRRVEKAPKKLEFSNFIKLFDKSQMDPIRVTTGISMIHCGRFLKNRDMEVIINMVKKEDEYLDKKDLKDILMQYEVVDANLRLLCDENTLLPKLTVIKNDGKIGEQVFHAIANKLKEVLSAKFYKVKLGYGKSFLYLKDVKTQLSLEECEVIKELLVTHPLKYLNLLELEYYQNEHKKVFVLLTSESLDTYKKLQKATENKEGYPDDTSEKKWFELVNNTDLDENNEKTFENEINKLGNEIKKLESEIKKICKELDPKLFENAHPKVESILDTYFKWNKHVGKTGGLRIQDRDMFLCVSKLEGDPFTIIGLPIESIFKFLHEFGIEIDISALYRDYWPKSIEFKKILNENQRNLLNRKTREDETLKRIREYGNLIEYGWALTPEIRTKEGLTLIKLAHSINNMPEMKNQIDNLDKILKNEKLNNDNIYRTFRGLLTDLQIYIEKKSDMYELSNEEKLQIARKIDDIGNSLYTYNEKISRYRELDREVTDYLGNNKLFQLQQDATCIHLENSHYSTINIPEIEKGILKFREILSQVDKNVYIFLLRELKPPLLNEFNNTPDEKSNYLKKISENYQQVVKNVLNSVFESIRDSFHYILESNELNYTPIQVTHNYIADDWQHFKDYIFNEIFKEEKSKIVICLGNNGTETMMSLWIAYLLLHLGHKVTLAVKSKPTMGNDCTKMTIDFVIPYFEFLIKKEFCNSNGAYIKPLLFFECNLKRFEIIEANNKQELENNKELTEGHNKIFTLFIGEVWYTEIVGKDDLGIPPFTPFKDKHIISTAYSLHVHKNRKKPLAVMNQNIFTRKGMFLAPELTTGWYISQIFRPISEDGEGWKQHNVKYRLDLGEGIVKIDLIKLINDNQDIFKELFEKDCHAYAGLQEPEAKIYCKDDEFGKLIYTYKSPHKFVIVEIRKDKIEITLLMEYDYARIFRTGGTEWETIKKKIPRLIAAIFTGLLFKHYERDQKKDFLSFEKIELAPYDEGKQSSDNNNGNCSCYNIELNAEKRCDEVEKFSNKISYEISIKAPSNIKLALDSQENSFLFAKVIIRYKTKDDEETRIRIYPARYANDLIKIRIQELWDETVNVEINGIAYFDLKQDLPIIQTTDLSFYIKKKGSKESIFEERKNNFLTVQDIKNAGAIAGPIDTLTTCDKRLDFAKIYTKENNGQKPIAFTELIRIGSIFLDSDITYRNYWSDPNYLSGLPRMEWSLEENKVIFQLAGPHNLPSEAPDWIFMKSENVELSNNSIVRVFSMSAQLAIFAGAAAIDINMCCTPLRNQGGGTELLKKPDLAYQIVKEVRGSIPKDILLSCKTRLLEEEAIGSFVVAEEKSKEFYRKLFENGVDWITVETRIDSDGQGLLNDNTARSKRNSLKKIIKNLYQESGDLTEKQCFLINGEIIHFNEAIKDFEDIKSTGCVGAVISMGIRVDSTVIKRCREYLHGNNCNIDMYQDKNIDDPADYWKLYKQKNESGQLVSYIASIIRGHDCANCDFRITCKEESRCLRIAKKFLDKVDSGFPDTIKYHYIMKRLPDNRRKKFKALWDLILANKSLWLNIKI